jgi:hypothetical protein
MKETPRPKTVRAQRTWGGPSAVSRSATTAAIAPGSWPSTLDHLPAEGAPALGERGTSSTSSVNPNACWPFTLTIATRFASRCWAANIAASQVWLSVTDQWRRPLQIESLGASFLLAAHQAFGTSVTGDHDPRLPEPLG